MPIGVQVESAALVSHPNDETLALYLCPLVAGSMVCRLLGPPVSRDRVKFVFDLVLDVQNPNPMPLPAIEALVAFTAYPDAPGQARVGVVCVALCPENEWCGPPPADGCRGGSEPSIKTPEDFVNASAGFLLASALGEVRPSDVRVRMLPAKENIQIKVRLELSPEQLAKLLLVVAKDKIAEVKRGRIPNFAIPYLIEGSVWLRVENFGKIGHDFGPMRNEWRL
jgi:hypothetical protein